MPLTVLSVAYPFAPVAPDTAGGAEQILYALDRALVQAGHRSFVVAAEGSQIYGELFTTELPSGTLTDDVRARIQVAHRARIESVLSVLNADVIHFHGIDFNTYLPENGPPALVTLHLPSSWYPSEIFSLKRPHTLLCCVSDSQRRQCPATAQDLPVIENGVEIPEWTTLPPVQNYVLALGRICPEKNLHVALDAGRLANVTTLLAGRVFPYPEHESYFQREILPRLDERRRFIAPVGGDEKQRLIASARCTLLPTLAPETSSLCAMESIACGTPVVAFPSGALPEIVEHGVTGFLVNSAEEMAAAIPLCDRLDRKRCIEIARIRFSLERMTRKYFETYEALAAKPAIHAAAMRVDLINNRSALKRIEPEWAELWSNDPRATPFQSPAWLMPWWNHFDDGELLTAAVRRGSRLVGLLPTYIYENEKLFPLGIGTSDYLGGVFTRDFEQSAVRAAFAALAHIPSWSRCEMPQLRERLPIDGAQHNHSESCYAIDLQNGALPGNISANLRYYRQRAERLGNVRVEVATAEQVDSFFDDLCRMHAQRWTDPANPGVLSDERVCAWHREMLPWLHGAGLLRFMRLTVGGRNAALLYGMAAKGRLYVYLTGFDDEFRAISPGALLLGEAVELARREGMTCVDLLRGTESYKKLWGAVKHPTWCVRFDRSGLLDKEVQHESAADRAR